MCIIGDVTSVIRESSAQNGALEKGVEMCCLVSYVEEMVTNHLNSVRMVTYCERTHARHLD